MLQSLGIIFCALAFSVALYALDLSSVEAVDVQTILRISICGDGIVQSESEACDEGQSGNQGAYATTTSVRTCAPGCGSFGPYCGDSILQVRFGEECDDGNHTSGDLCTLSCKAETAVVPGGGGSPTVGSTPSIPGATPGTIPSQTETRVVLRGKAYPGSTVNILLDGKITGTTRADSNANFLYSTAEITPGTATFGFSSQDRNGIGSITTSVVFEVVQSAVTTVANIFFPPTISVNERRVAVGDLLTLSGQTVPSAKVVTEMSPGKTSLEASADTFGVWALQVDTGSISEGVHNIKAYFEENSSARSGFGKSVSFTVGDGPATGSGAPDLSGDGKVNLVDFSIFLVSWGTDDALNDFNNDGAVNLADFSIMLFNWTG